MRVVLWDEKFPVLNGWEITQDMIKEACGGDCVFVRADELAAKLAAAKIFINPYGETFPRSVWEEFLKFLRRGGGFINLGGLPFNHPVRFEEGEWRIETEQASLRKRLYINHGYEQRWQEVKEWRGEENFELPGGLSFKGSFGFDVKLSQVSDEERELGSSGRRDGRIRALVAGYSEDGRRIASPIVGLDWLGGEFAGGRWVVASGRVEGDKGQIVQLLREIIEWVEVRAFEMIVEPAYALFYAGEAISCNIRVISYERRKGRVKIVCDREGEKIFETSLEMEVAPFINYEEVHFGGGFAKPGLYHIRAEFVDEGGKILDSYDSGFFVFEEGMLKAGMSIKAGRDYLLIDGKSYPIVGTTYMDSLFHRKFIYHNPYRWDEDFRKMREAGINCVRTGIWTGYRQIMVDVGEVNERVLRAITAFVAVAARHRMPVIFTFFAFLPERWGGVNHYLDEGALRAQEAYVKAIASRIAESDCVIWDLINEPSFENYEYLWELMPNWDEFEEEAWRAWVIERHGNAQRACEAWRVADRQEALKLPTQEDFRKHFIFQGTYPLKMVDFALFGQDVFKRWVRRMRGALEEAGARGLVTVGQDEGGTFRSPAPQFHYDVVDFTCNHTWWKNDYLLWDCVATKVLGVPNLIEETGIMFVEDISGLPRRSEEDCKRLLERKFVYAFAAGCAGVIQWIWNTNCHMIDENECSIGALRADGTEKREADVLRNVAKFIAKVGEEFCGRREEEVCIVIPYSNLFTSRECALEATRKSIKALHHFCKVEARACGEYSLQKLGNPKLVILPCAMRVNEEAWEKLVEYVERGGTLLITGPVGQDEYARPVRRLAKFGLSDERSSVARDEVIEIEGREFSIGFEEEKYVNVDKGDGEIARVAVGEGKIIYCPLPIEVGDNMEAVAGLYNMAIEEAGVERRYLARKLLSQVVVRVEEFEKGSLVCMVNEGGSEALFDIDIPRFGVNIRGGVDAGRGCMVFVSERRVCAYLHSELWVGDEKIGGEIDSIAEIER